MKENKNKMSKEVKATIAYFFSSVVSVGLAYLTTPLFTRLLSSEEFGRVSVYSTLVQLIGIVAMFCLSYGVFNNGMMDYPDKRDEYSFSILILSNVITIVVFTLLSIFKVRFTFLKVIEWPLLVLMFVLFLVQPAYNFWISRQRFELNYKPVFWVASICSLLSVGFSAIAVIFLDSIDKTYSRIFGMEIPLIIIYSIFYIASGTKNGWKVNKTYWKEVFTFNLYLIPHYLSTYLLGSSDKIMISLLISDSAVAYYTIAYSVASVVMIVWSAVNGSMVPFTYSKLKNNEFESLNEITKPVLLIFGTCSIALILLAPEVIRIMAPSEYYEAIFVVPPVVGGVFFQVQYYLFANVLYYYKKPYYVMLGSMIAMLLNILLNYLFIPRYGYVAAGFTTLICYLVQAMIDYFAMRKVAKQRIYNISYILILSFAIAFIALISRYIYCSNTIRFVLLVLFFLLAIYLGYKNYRRLVKLLGRNCKQ